MKGISILPLQLLLLFLSLSAQAQVFPQQFGAKADGKSDDTEAIQKALDKGGTIVLTKGLYKTTETLYVWPNTTIIGEDGAIVLPRKDSFVFANKHSQMLHEGYDSNIRFEGVTIDASNVKAISEYSAGIYLCGVSDVTIRKCKFEHTGGDAVCISVSPDKKNNRNILIKDCIFRNYGRSEENPRQGVAIILGDNINIEDCSFTNSRKQAYAIDFEPNNADEGGTLNISGCSITGCGISCIGNMESEKTVHIENCVINCSKMSESPISFGNTKGYIANSELYGCNEINGINLIESPDVVVSGNTIIGCSAGIMVTDYSNNGKIKDNTIESCSTGIYLIKSSAVTIGNNTIKNIKGNGIYIRIGSESNILKGNDIQSEGTDIFIQDGNKTKIVKNTCMSVNENIVLTGNNVLIRSNRISSNKIRATGNQIKQRNNK